MVKSLLGKRISRTELVATRLRERDFRETYAGLLWLAKNKGYKNGWVAHKFKEIFGKWPKPQSVVEPKQPDTLLVEYLGIMRKRWRARKKREEAKSGAPILTAFKSREEVFEFSGNGLDCD